MVPSQRPARSQGYDVHGPRLGFKWAGWWLPSRRILRGFDGGFTGNYGIFMVFFRGFYRDLMRIFMGILCHVPSGTLSQKAMITDLPFLLLGKLPKFQLGHFQ